MSLSTLKTVYSETVEVVQPHRRVPQLVEVRGGEVLVGEDRRKRYALSSGRRNCYMVGFGKAVSGMAVALERVLGPDHLAEGIISVPVGSQETFRSSGREDLVLPKDSRIKVFEGAMDNLPDEASFAASRAIVELIKSLCSDDVLFVLISGGGSALLPFPCPPVTLEEKSSLIRSLSRAGATIQEMNSVRKRISLVKGGRLASMARPASVAALILSDIVGDPLDLISCAPTVRNVDPPSLARDILAKYSKEIESIPQSVQKILDDPHTSQDDPLDHVQNILIGNIDLALEGMVWSCRERGFSALLGSNKIVGEARRLGKLYARIAHHACSSDEDEVREVSRLLREEFDVAPTVVDKFVAGAQELRRSPGGSNGGRTLCLVNGGEPTVKVCGQGRGGRNQELALAFAQELHRLCSSSSSSSSLSDLRNKFEVYLMSAGTDGIDGPTPAAGAIGHAALVEDALRQGLDVGRTLEDNDSHTFFSALNGGRELVSVGHTGTNVMDVHLLSICAK